MGLREVCLYHTFVIMQNRAMLFDQALIRPVRVDLIISFSYLLYLLL